MPLSSAFLRTIVFKRETIPDPPIFPWNLPVFQGLRDIDLDPAVTIFVGENGSGKSTLVEGIAVAAGMNEEGGGRNHRFSTHDNGPNIADSLRLVRGTRRPRTEFFLRAETFYNVATNYHRLEDLSMRNLHLMSHGESFLKLVLERFGPDGLYLLDEPEAALSPQNLLTLIKRLHDLVAQRCQFIIATHSPILLAYPGATVYQLGEDGVTKVDYRDTRHFALTRRFLADPGSVLQRLLREDAAEE